MGYSVNYKTIGLIVILMVAFSSCEKKHQNVPPNPGYKLRPPGGNTETIFNFDASESSDAEDSLSDLKFRWDWESDGRWDTEWTSEPVREHRFLQSGVYQIDLEVMDTDGAISLVFEFVDVIEFFLFDNRDNHEYRTIQIGDQLWMAENLNYMTYSGSWCHNDSIENCEKQGRIYDWYTAQTICPAGWSLPSGEDWDELIAFVGENPSDKLRSLSGWNSDLNGSDTYGLNVMPAGYRHDYGAFAASDSYAYFWSTDIYSEMMAWSRLMSYDRPEVKTNFLNKGNAFSVRCLRD